MSSLFDDVEMEPEPGEQPFAQEQREAARDEQFQFHAEVKSAPERHFDVLPLDEDGSAQLARHVAPQALPDFDITMLLRFLPDPKLKQLLDAEAQRALAIEVKDAAGLQLADAALGRLKDGIAGIEKCFDDPTSLAYALHKRLTGLRADFCATGKAAVEQVGNRIYVENKRLASIAEEARREEQRKADEKARADTLAAAKDAKAQGAPKEFVQELTKAAKTMTAAPVASPVPAPVLARSSIKPDWRARFSGDDSADLRPAVKDMTELQRAQCMTLLHAVVAGQVPLAAIKELDWTYLDKRADAEKTTLLIPGIEAYDKGRVSSKPQRRK